jgi:hypothetical protein
MSEFKVGDIVLRKLDDVFQATKYTICGISADGLSFMLESPDGEVCISYRAYLIHIPSYEVEGRPLYVGSMLFWKRDPGVVLKILDLTRVQSAADDRMCCVDVNTGRFRYPLITELTWDKPKIKKVGWINIFEGGVTSEYLYPTEADALDAAGSNYCLGQFIVNYEG